MTSNKNVYYELFNEKLDELFKDLIISFPDITEFKRFKSGLTLLRNVDPKSPQAIFNNYVITKFKEAILSKDDSFFLDNDDFGIVSARKDYWIEFINQLKLLWKTIDNDNKDVIWKYLHVLYVLSDKCGNK
jgi:hypothetical protein